MVQHPVTGDIYIGTGENIFRTTDGGSSFDLVKSFYYTAGGVSNIVFNQANEMIVSVNGMGLFKSVSGDIGTFVFQDNAPNTGDTTNFKSTHYRLVNCESAKNILYCAESDLSSNGYLSGVYRSADGGLTWTKVTGNPKDHATFGSPSNGFILSVKPDDSDYIICGGVSPAFSRDGGTTWGKVYNFPGVDYTSVHWSHSNTNNVYVTSDHGVSVLRADNIENWGYGTDIGEVGLNNSQIYKGDYFNEGDGFLIGAQDNQSRYSPNGYDHSIWLSGGDGVQVATHKQNNIKSIPKTPKDVSKIDLSNKIIIISELMKLKLFNLFSV